MAETVMLPKLGNSVESCMLVKWCCQPGDTLSLGQVMCEVETDKTTVEVESAHAGTVLQLLVEEGAEVPVFSPILILSQPGENASALAFAQQASPSTPSTPSTASSLPAHSPQRNTDQPAAMKTAVMNPHEPAAGHAATDQTPSPNEGPFISPRGRKWALERGVEQKELLSRWGEAAGSGPQGRVLERDVQQLLTSAPQLPAPGAPAATPEKLAPATPEGLLEQSLSKRRQVIARRMLQSLSSHAQLTLHRQAPAASLLRWRQAFKNSDDPELQAISINDLLLFVVARSLKSFPQLNAHWNAGHLFSCKQINLGFAMDSPDGLAVLVIEQADQLSLRQLSGQTQRLISAARAGKLAAPSQPGSFTVSNLGAMGIDYFTPILNSPEVAILGVGAISEQPYHRGEKMEWEQQISLSLTLDHQALDGADGARFLADLAKKLTQLELLFG